MTNEKQGHFEAWKQRHETLWQFILFSLMSGFTTVVDLGTFAICNFWLFASLGDTPFSWWLINYSVQNGGIRAFLSFAISFAISQTFNFFLQRKTTFKANNNLGRSAAMYALMVLLVYFLQLYIPTLVYAPIIAALGETLGDLAIKFSNMIVSMLIQFPINKWVIMRKD